MCCGRNSQATNTVGGQAAAARSQSTAGAQYVGKTAMTVLGPVSGKIYRFSSPGERVELDRRDLTGLASVPKLKFVR
jgi:hypothetical protein